MASTNTKSCGILLLAALVVVGMTLGAGTGVLGSTPTPVQGAVTAVSWGLLAGLVVRKHKIAVAIAAGVIAAALFFTIVAQH